MLTVLKQLPGVRSVCVLEKQKAPQIQSNDFPPDLMQKISVQAALLFNMGSSDLFSIYTAQFSYQVNKVVLHKLDDRRMVVLVCDAKTHVMLLLETIKRLNL